MSRPTVARAVRAVEEHGVLLVYPVQNRREPLSLWHVFYPRTEMRWAWDDSADDRVVGLWHLREELARSRRVVYSKWLGGRATFFSLDIFRAMLAELRARGAVERGLSGASRTLLELLRDDSPQPTRALREAADLAGATHEAAFTRAMRPLWQRLLVVGAGEVEDGGFPSLAVGATELLFESLSIDASSPRAGDAELLARVSSGAPSFGRAWRRVSRAIRADDLALQ